MEGKNTPAQHVKNGFACTNCHADLLTYARHTVAKVTFPSGVTVRQRQERLQSVHDLPPGP